MYDREDDDANAVAVEAAPPFGAALKAELKKLQTAAFLLHGVSQRLHNECDAVAQACSEMRQAVKAFESHLQSLRALDKTLPQHIAQTLEQQTRQARGDVVAAFSRTLAQACETRLHAAIAQTQQAAEALTTQLEATQARWKGVILRHGVGFIALAVLSAFLSAWLMSNFAQGRRTEPQWRQIAWGQAVQQSWPTLTPSQRKTLLRLVHLRESTP